MRTHLFLSGLLPLLLWGCASDADLPLAISGSRVPLEVSGSVGSLTRATDGRWEAGDEIGVFMLSAGGPLSGDHAAGEAFNRSYRHVSDGRFTPSSASDTIRFPLDPSEKVDLIAYHPYREVDADDPLLPIDLTDPSVTPDILYADRVEGRDSSDPRVSFVFRHAMSRMTVDLTAGEGTTVSDLAGAAFRLGGQYLRGVCDLSDGSVRATGDIGALSFTGHSAILFPSGGMEGRTLYISLPALGKELSWTLPAGKSFAPGEQTAYHVTVNRKGGEVDPEPSPDPTPDPEIELGVTSKIVSWLEGGNQSGNAE